MNNAFLLTLLGFYTFIIVGGISYYEDKLKKIDNTAKLYRDIYESEHNAIHHQIEINEILDIDNQTLRKVVKDLKVENAALKNAIPAQYEYTAWQSNTYNSLYEQTHRPKGDEE